jgi:hypothetical protein
MSFKKWKDFLWPLGATLLSLLVMPIAMMQYPQFFSENTWVLPVSFVAALSCWIVPLFFHDRTRRMYSSIVAIPKYGNLLLGFVCLAFLATCVFGGGIVLRFHRNHFKKIAAQSQQVVPVKPVSQPGADAAPKFIPPPPMPDENSQPKVLQKLRSKTPVASPASGETAGTENYGTIDSVTGVPKHHGTQDQPTATVTHGSNAGNPTVANQNDSKPSSQSDCSKLKISDNKMIDSGGAAVDIQTNDLSGVCISGNDMERNMGGGVVVKQSSETPTKGNQPAALK